MLYGRSLLFLLRNSVWASAILESAASRREACQWRAGAFQPPAGGASEVLSTLRTKAASPHAGHRPRRPGQRPFFLLRLSLRRERLRYLHAPAQDNKTAAGTNT